MSCLKMLNHETIQIPKMFKMRIYAVVFYSKLFWDCKDCNLPPLFGICANKEFATREVWITFSGITNKIAQMS